MVRLTGLRCLTRRSAFSVGGPLPQVVVALHNQRGVLMLRFGKLRAAIEAFDEAEKYFSTAVPLERANVLLIEAAPRWASET